MRLKHFVTFGLCIGLSATSIAAFGSGKIHPNAGSPYMDYRFNQLPIQLRPFVLPNRTSPNIVKVDTIELAKYIASLEEENLRLQCKVLYLEKKELGIECLDYEFDFILESTE